MTKRIITVSDLLRLLERSAEWIEASVSLTPDVKGIRTLAKGTKLRDEIRATLAAVKEDD